MADLRDQLLKAGLIDRKAKQAADTEARREKKKKKKKPKAAAGSEEAAKRAEWEAAQQRQAEENRQRAAALALERQHKEQQNRIANLAGAGAIRDTKPGARRWSFVSRSKRILWVYVSEEVALGLARGALAIVERPGDSDEPHALVPRQIAERIAELDPEAVRFWNREGEVAPEDDAPASSR